MKSPVQAKPSPRGALLYSAEGASQSCDVFKCGVTVAACAGVCIGTWGSPACIACLGPLYESCKDCF
jgi:hypothetical protein